MKKYLACIGWALVFFFATSHTVMAFWKGSGYLENTYLDELEYRIVNGRVIIDKISWKSLPWEEYPCEAAFKYMKMPGKLTRCTLTRNIKGFNEEKNYTDGRQLTRSELHRFFMQTGDVGPTTGTDRYTFFNISLGSSLGSSYGSYIPTGYDDESAQIPPTNPPPPPLSCSMGGGTISYGSLDESKVDNAKAKTSISVYCNRQASAHIVANQYSNTTGMPMGNNGALAAFLTINGSPAATGKRLTVSSWSSVSIESTLRKKNTQLPAGAYQGSVVLTMNVD
ncbi:MrpH family fimbial adhesin [Serratia silvae]|uniref:Fimbrial adhesin MrpH C-terminal domain-containing protein n=1 Tax=Serratia silvae TaxID=2824122 RepID=A0ABT0KH74_9GAMM|nr:hypothetical protein [Serratia silvae]MCL1031287.1 hypothetical protein [Serratia silvae]